MFSIKVHRSITHYTKPIQLWKKFRHPLKSIDKRIIFWLFQMPSAFKYNVENVNRIRNFENIAKLGARAVIEFRDSSWWNDVNHKDAFDLLYKEAWRPEEAAMGNSTLPTVLVINNQETRLDVLKSKTK